jgi:hypothetical protein
MNWLAGFHRRWQAARGKRVTAASRAFSVGWIGLLEMEGITSAEDQATAAREGEAFEKSGHFIIKRHRYRTYLIERITLPLDQEPWLIQRFGGVSAGNLQAEALRSLESISRKVHTRFPEEWSALCATLRSAFEEGRSLRPFYWNQPESLGTLLEVIARIGETDWPPGTLIRAASVDVGQDSKWLERHRRTCESGLGRLLGEEITLRSLGLVEGDASVELSGPVCLHFPDGGAHDFDGLTNPILSAADLARCESISTPAQRLLSIENRKTTFRQYAAANLDRRTLIAATSFPTPAFREFLRKLPPALPHHHFGDTDPAGWHILLKLREATSRPVEAFRMKWRASRVPAPITPHDRKLLEKLLAEPLLADVREEIRIIAEREDRGDFEQETLGPPAGTERCL